MICTSPEHKSLMNSKEYGTKFHSKLLSKDSTLQACPSFRVYYGVAPASVPFLWESQPGTPKHSIPTTTLPPLTPPPSYSNYNNNNKTNTNKPSRHTSLFKAILPRLLSLRKRNTTPTPKISSSYSSSSSSIYSFSPNCSLSSRHSRVSSSRSLFSSGPEDEASGAQRKVDGAVRRCHSMVIVKNAFLSIVGHGSSRGTIA